MIRIKFDEIDQVERRPGIYEIYTSSDVALKVGSGKNLRRRLRQHRASSQRALKLKPGGCFDNPSDVASKQSILAKHLYYDGSIAPAFNLRSEDGRQRFLMSQCYMVIEYTESWEDAKTLEASRESQVAWRYKRRVEKR